MKKLFSKIHNFILSDSIVFFLLIAGAFLIVIYFTSS